MGTLLGCDVVSFAIVYLILTSSDRFGSIYIASVELEVLAACVKNIYRQNFDTDAAA